MRVDQYTPFYDHPPSLSWEPVGNKFTLCFPGEQPIEVVGRDAMRQAELDRIKRLLAHDEPFRTLVKTRLRGKDLACSCNLDRGICHAFLLMDFANAD